MSATDLLSFHLSDDFVKKYRRKKPEWGFPTGAGNSLGEITFLTKYSRRKSDGTKERWFETCQRVIEGYYSILKDHCRQNRTPWNEYKAQKAAEDAYDRLFQFKWTPPGRGLWMMGTPMVNGEKNSAALQNCAFISTEKLSSHSAAEATMPFVRLMEMSMLGVGVGFDTKGAGNLAIHKPRFDSSEVFEIDDSREGWFASVQRVLEAYFFKNRTIPAFNYNAIRPAGAPIETFGGIAAGPEPLRTLHENIFKLFAGRAGEKITSSDIVDIMNMVGKCVVSGNVRRSAEIAVGNLHDEAFLDLKNPDSERMGPDGWGYTSNNSVFAEIGDDISTIIPRVERNGEPGLLYLDLCKEFGRLIDPPNYRDHRAAGTNPCVTGDTWVMTSEGPRRAVELVDVPFTALLDGQEYPSSGFWKTGDKEVVKITFTDGRELTVTPDHQIRTVTNMTRKTREEDWVEAGDLDIGDTVVLSNNSSVAFDYDDLFELGYVVGHFIGDGTFSNGRARLNVWEQDPGHSTPAKQLLARVEQWNHHESFKGWSGPHGNGWSALSTTSLTGSLSCFDIVPGSKTITDKVESHSNPSFIAGTLRGLFDTDGSVQGDHRKGFSVRLAQSDKSLLQAAQRMLGRLGVNSTIYHRRDAGQSFLPDGRGGYDFYDTKEQWELVISKSNINLFAERVGFYDDIKSAKLRDGLASLRREPNRERFVATVTSIEPAGIQPVYDASVDGVHAFDANGIYVHNCGEQTLESYECCTLVETFPTRHDDLDDYLQTLKHAYLYGKAVTLLPTHWPETNEVMQRNRRIGCSMSGVAQFLENNQAGWTKLREWMNEGYFTIQNRDKQYSEWLGVRESIKTTSIKPSGTVSLLAGVTPGVHWPTADTYIRRMRLSPVDPLVQVLIEAGYRVESDIMDPNNSVVVELPTKGPNVRTEREVTMWEKADLAVVAQRYWADNQVSVTVTFQEHERDQIAPLLQSKEGQLKSISMLPLTEEGAYKQMPYERITDEQFEVLTEEVQPMNMADLYAGKALDAEGEKFCTNDVCEIV